MGRREMEARVNPGGHETESGAGRVHAELKDGDLILFGPAAGELLDRLHGVGPASIEKVDDLAGVHPSQPESEGQDAHALDRDRARRQLPGIPRCPRGVQHLLEGDHTRPAVRRPTG